MAVVCSVPLLGEAVRSALDFAEVLTFAGDTDDLRGLLDSLRPDAVVVDGDEAAVEAGLYACDQQVPAVHIAARARELRVFRDGDWEQAANGEEGPTPEYIRNVLAGALYARGGAAA